MALVQEVHHRVHHIGLQHGIRVRSALGGEAATNRGGRPQVGREWVTLGTNLATGPPPIQSQQDTAAGRAERFRQ